MRHWILMSSELLNHVTDTKLNGWVCAEESSQAFVGITPACQGKNTWKLTSNFYLQQTAKICNRRDSKLMCNVVSEKSSSSQHMKYHAEWKMSQCSVSTSFFILCHSYWSEQLKIKAALAAGFCSFCDKQCYCDIINLHDSSPITNYIFVKDI